MTGGARQVADGQGHEEAAEREPGQWPPQRFAVETEAVWKIVKISVCTLATPSRKK